MIDNHHVFVLSSGQMNYQRPANDPPATATREQPPRAARAAAMRARLSTVAIALTAALAVAGPGAADAVSAGENAAGPRNPPRLLAYDLAEVADDEIPVGVTLPLRGSFETYGQSALTGLIARFQEQNAAGGVRGRFLRLVLRDNHGRADDAAADVAYFVGKDGQDEKDAKEGKNVKEGKGGRSAPVVIGPLFTGAANHAAAVARERDVPLISPLALLCYDASDEPWLFRIANSAVDQARAMAYFQIHNYGAQRAALLVDNRYRVSGELAGLFRDAFVELGGEIVAEFEPGPAAPPKGDPEDADNQTLDFTEILDRLEADPPDLLYAPCYARVVVELVQAIEKRPALAGVTLCGPDFWDNSLVFDGSGRRVDGACFTSALFESRLPWPPYQRFLSSMREYGIDNPDAQSVCAYDAASLAIEALEKGGLSAQQARGYLLRGAEYDMATGRMFISRLGETYKQRIQLRILEIRDGWPVPSYSQLPVQFRPTTPPADTDENADGNGNGKNADATPGTTP